jgi:spore coat protein U-like protein
MIGNFSKRNLNFAIVATFAVIGVGFGSNSYAAGSSTANLGVSATVDATCTLLTGDVSFGSYDAGNGTSAAGSLNVYCGVDGTVATVTLGQGLNDTTGSAAIPARRMSNGASVLAYNLYQDASHTTLWGNTSGTGVVVTGNPDGPAYSVYGLIPAGQSPPIGSYSDTVVATISF